MCLDFVSDSEYWVIQNWKITYLSIRVGLYTDVRYESSIHIYK